MQVERNECESFLLEVTSKLVNLAAMCEESPDPEWVVIEVAAGMGVRGDVHVVEVEFASSDQAEAIAQIGLSRAHGFHFRTQKFDPGF